MEKFIPYEKLSKKKKAGAGRRQANGLDHQPGDSQKRKPESL